MAALAIPLDNQQNEIPYLKLSLHHSLTYFLVNDSLTYKACLAKLPGLLGEMAEWSKALPC